MTCERHIFLKGICDAPGCSAEAGEDGDANWFYDIDDLVEAAWDDDWASVKRKGKAPLLYCPEHSRWNEEEQERVPAIDTAPEPQGAPDGVLDAIAYGIWKADANMASPDPGESEHWSAWLGLPPMIRNEYRRKAGIVKAEIERTEA